MSVSQMHHLVRVARSMLGTGLAFGALLVLSTSPTLADCESNYYFIDQPTDVQGTTFTGTYLGRVSDSLPETDSFRVDKTYAGEPAATVTYDVQICHPFKHLSTGESYLFSTSDIAKPTAKNTVIYRLERPGVALVGLDGSAADYIPIWHVDSLSEALALVAPGSLPPTDESALRKDAAGEMDAEALAVLAACLGLLGAVMVDSRLRGRKLAAP